MSPAVWRRIHASLTVVWALLLIPTLLWWRESIFWIAAMSLYANFVGHFSAYQAARAEGESNESPSSSGGNG